MLTLKLNVLGVMDVCGLSAKVLIDSWATHSFINSNFARRLNMTPIPMNSWFNILTPSRDVMESTSSLRVCAITFGDHALFINLIVLRVRDFDAVLGMDLFSKYRVNINFHEKVVVFQLLNEQSSTFIGIKPNSAFYFIFTMKAQQMLSKGCEGYLVSLIEVSNEELTV